MPAYDQVKTQNQMHATNKVATNSNKMLVEDQMQGNRGNNNLLGAPQLLSRSRFLITKRVSSKFELRIDRRPQEMG